MAKYLIIKNIEINKANANPVWYLVGVPALTAYHGFIQALLLSLLNEDVNEAKNLALHEGFAVVHHEIQMLGAMNKYGNVFLPNQISSAHAYDKGDYVKSGTSLSSQPTATCNLLIDLIIKLPKEIKQIDENKIKNFLYMGKIAGGKINVSNKESSPKLFIVESYDEILKLINTGFYIVDRNDLLKNKDSKTTLELLLEKTRNPKDKSERKESWLVPNSVGYLCLTDFNNRSNSRNGNEVAYAEPVVTLTQYCSVRKMKEIPFWEWKKEVTNNGKNLFILKGETK